MADAVIEKYYTKVTDAGLAAEALAKVQNTPIHIATMQVGDSNGVEYDPDGSETALRGFKWEGPINALTQHPDNPNWWIAEAVLPDEVGGFTMRELSLRLDNGVFYAISKYPPSFKPVLAQGSNRQVYVRAIFEVSNDVQVTLLVDPAIVMASQSFVNDALQKHVQAEDPHPAYWNNARGDAKIRAAINALVDGASEALDTLKELSGALNNDAQFATHILAQIAARPACYPITGIPAENKGPIIVAEAEEVWTWKDTAYFHGYRSNLCGRPVDGHTLVPLPHEIDAIGGVLSKTAYAGLWAYARENNFVVTQAIWEANRGAHYFVDLGGDNFRVPDLRDMFRRYTGTDADTANARAMGSRQLDALQNITGTWSNVILRDTTNTSGAFAAGPGNGSGATGTSGSGTGFSFDASRVARTSSETRGRNVAFVPRLHV